MRVHRDRRATPQRAKSARREAVTRREPPAGFACLRVASATRRRCAHCQRLPPSIPTIAGYESGPWSERAPHASPCATNR